jgi:hypothetical protein
MKNEKEPKTCHECGLEDYDACEDTKPSTHMPDNENLAPCKYCVRNPKRPQQRWLADFHCEMWTRSGDAEYTPEISDPDPNERALLRTLHFFINESTPTVFQEATVICKKIEKQGGE